MTRAKKTLLSPLFALFVGGASCIWAFAALEKAYGEPQANGNPESSGRPPKPAVANSAEERVEAFLSVLGAEYEGLELESSRKTDRMDFSVYGFKGGGTVVAGNSPAVIHLYKRGTLRGRSSPVSNKADAWSRARPILKYHGYEAKEDEYHVTEIPFGVVDGERQTAWRIWRELDYGGVPCRYAHIFLLLDSQTGEFASISYQPAMPAKVSHGGAGVSAPEARTKLMDWLPDVSPCGRYSLRIQDDVKAKKVIAFPVRVGRAFGEERSDWSAGSDLVYFKAAYSCWEFVVDLDELNPRERADERHPRQERYWIDRNTSEIVGGMPARDE